MELMKINEVVLPGK